MKHIKRDFRFKACSRPPGQFWGCGQKVNIKLFQSMVMLEIICNHMYQCNEDSC